MARTKNYGNNNANAGQRRSNNSANKRNTQRNNNQNESRADARQRRRQQRRQNAHQRQMERLEAERKKSEGMIKHEERTQAIKSAERVAQQTVAQAGAGATTAVGTGGAAEIVDATSRKEADAAYFEGLHAGLKLGSTTPSNTNDTTSQGGSSFDPARR